MIGLEVLAPIDTKQIEVLTTAASRIVEQWLKVDVELRNLARFTRDSPVVTLEGISTQEEVAVQTEGDTHVAGFVPLAQLMPALLRRCMIAMGLVPAIDEIRKIANSVIPVDTYTKKISDFFSEKNCFMIELKPIMPNDLAVKSMSILGFNLKKHLGRMSFEFIREQAALLYIEHLKEVAVFELWRSAPSIGPGNDSRPMVN